MQFVIKVLRSATRQLFHSITFPPPPIFINIQHVLRKRFIAVNDEQVSKHVTEWVSPSERIGPSKNCLADNTQKLRTPKNTCHLKNAMTKHLPNFFRSCSSFYMFCTHLHKGWVKISDIHSFIHAYLNQWFITFWHTFMPPSLVIFRNFSNFFQSRLSFYMFCTRLQQRLGKNLWYSFMLV